VILRIIWFYMLSLLPWTFTKRMLLYIRVTKRLLCMWAFVLGIRLVVCTVAIVTEDTIINDFRFAAIIFVSFSIFFLLTNRLFYNLIPFIFPWIVWFNMWVFIRKFCIIFPFIILAYWEQDLIVMRYHRSYKGWLFEMR